MNMITLRALLARALKEGTKFSVTKPGGRGAYDFEFDETLELEVDGETITLHDEWCGYCYRQFITCGDFSCRVSQLDGVSRKILGRVGVATDEEIARELGVESLLA